MMKLKTKILFFILFFSINLYAQNNDTIEICGLRLHYSNKIKTKNREEYRITGEIKFIRQYNINGKIKSETIWYNEDIPIWSKKVYNKKGSFKIVNSLNQIKYGYCELLISAYEHDLLKNNCHIILLDKNNWEYPNHWLISYDFDVSDTGYKSKGIVINIKTGEEKEYYTETTLNQQNQEDLIMGWFVEKFPEFQGGIDSLRKYIQSNIIIPKDSIIQGRVFVSFWIDTLGQVTDAKIARGINVKQNNEALRIINSLPKWQPGETRGKKIKVPYTIPVIFKKDE
ncbi:MAG: hypothetical protein DRJ01_17415 [Bacteroidetes bacterium]|nr:MAG: hypothetical protein DRJ01_17415 [Bacteroidota bacterium]